MQRGYDRAHVEALMASVRAAFPDVVIRSEVIVGFPGETETEFEELKRFLGDFAFDSLGVFPYSPEPGTRAPALDGQLHPELIRERASEITELQEALSFAARARFAGTTLRVLIDRAAEPGEFAPSAGRFYGQAPDIDGEVFVTGDARIGDFADVRITETDVFDLCGEVVPALGTKEQ
jgi:ribosomal protein S12 methylthiotransferase